MLNRLYQLVWREVPFGATQLESFPMLPDQHHCKRIQPAVIEQESIPLRACYGIITFHAIDHRLIRTDRASSIRNALFATIDDKGWQRCVGAEHWVANFVFDLFEPCSHLWRSYRSSRRFSYGFK